MKISYIYPHNLEAEMEIMWNTLIRKFTKDYGMENIPTVADVTIHSLNDSYFDYEVDDYASHRFTFNQRVKLRKTENTIKIVSEAVTYCDDERTEETETELIVFTQKNIDTSIDQSKVMELQRYHEGC